MPQGSTRINKPLSNISVQYRNENYIARDVLKDIIVNKESDLYWVHNSNFRLEETARANGSPANMATISFSTSSYRAQEQALKDVITETDAANTDAPLNLQRDITEYLTDQILLKHEVDAMTLLFTTTTFSNNVTLTTATTWNYAATTTADPIGDVLSATGVILAASAQMPNKLVVGWSTFEVLKENQNIHERVKYVQKSIVTKELLASLFDLEQVHVGTAIRDSAKEGATENQGFIWGADAMLGYFAPRPGIKTKTAAATFRVSRKGNPMRVRRWYEDDIEGTFIEVSTKYDMKAIATACGFLFKTVNLI